MIDTTITKVRGVIVDAFSKRRIQDTFAITFSQTDVPTPTRFKTTNSDGSFEIDLPNTWDLVDAVVKDRRLAYYKNLKNERKKTPWNLEFDRQAVASADAVPQSLAELESALPVKADLDAVVTWTKIIGTMHSQYLDEQPGDRQRYLLLQGNVKIALDARARDLGGVFELPLPTRTTFAYAMIPSGSVSGSAYGAAIANVYNLEGITTLSGVDVPSAIGTTVSTLTMPAESAFFDRLNIPSDEDRRPFGLTGVPAFAAFTSQWRFGVRYDNVSKSVTSRSIESECRCPEGRTGFARSQFHDVLAYGGGRVVQDRIWTTVIFQYHRDDASQPGTDPAKPAQSATTRFVGRLRWNATENLSVEHGYSGTFWSRSDTPTLGSPFETLTTYSGNHSAATLAKIAYTHGKSFWQSDVSGRFAVHDRAEPNTSNQQPWRHDLSTGFSQIGSYGNGDFSLTQVSLAGNVIRLLGSSLGSNNQIATNLRFTHQLNRAAWAYPGGAHIYEDAGAPSFANFQARAVVGSQNDELTGFGKYTAQLFERLHAQFSGRYQRSSAASPDIPETDVTGRESGKTIQGLGHFFTWNRVSGGASLTYNIRADGSLAIRGQWQRTYQDTDVNQLVNLHPGNTPSTLAYFDQRTGTFSAITAVVDPSKNLQLDPQLKAPRTDLTEVQVSWAPTSRSSVQVAYQRSDRHQLIGWQDSGGIYGRAEITTAAGTVPVRPLLNATSSRLFELSNPEGWFLRQNGLNVKAAKWWGQGASLTGSYMLSRSEGLNPSSGWRFGESGYDLLTRFGQDPNDLTNATGVLPDDHPHLVQVVMSYPISGIGLQIGASFRYVTGAPYTPFVNVRLPQGTQQIFVEAPGNRRLDAQNILDLRLARSFGLASQQRLEVFGYLLNALNSAAAIDVLTANIQSANFGRPSQIIEPRRLFVGIRVSR